MQENVKSAGIWGDVLSFSVYKRNQGRVTRQVTFAALATIVAVGVWRLAQLLAIQYGGGDSPLSSLAGGADLGVVRFLVPGGLFFIGTAEGRVQAGCALEPIVPGAYRKPLKA